MPRGVPATSTVRNAEAVSVWQRFVFPTRDVSISAMSAMGDRWFAAKNKLGKPFCWTPTKGFRFGGKQFIPLYPCVAYATRDFGHIIQQGPYGLIWGRE